MVPKGQITLKLVQTLKYFLKLLFISPMRHIDTIRLLLFYTSTIFDPLENGVSFKPHKHPRSDGLPPQSNHLSSNFRYQTEKTLPRSLFLQRNHSPTSAQPSHSHTLSHARSNTPKLVIPASNSPRLSFSGKLNFLLLLTTISAASEQKIKIPVTASSGCLNVFTITVIFIFFCAFVLRYHLGFFDFFASQSVLYFFTFQM